jgi:hypothetical protein
LPGPNIAFKAALHTAPIREMRNTSKVLVETLEEKRIFL